ncbi:MAG TPA: OsmC family protein [Polyangiaceae bacterium]|nr:OsmC family protein [Polyangiaceae bacterium]
MTTPASTMTYTVTASTRRGGTASVRARASDIAFDGSAQAGETLPGPADLLCAALSACILKNVERFSKILPFRYESASIEVTAEREEPPPRIVRMHYKLRVVTDEPTARIELLHKNIRKFGTITNTLAAACELTGEIDAVSSGRSP